MPILDKITNKTLVLQNYALSQGHCRGLAKSFQYLDVTRVNRVLFNNCGISGREFAELLRGLQKLRDVKSITYKQNQFSHESLAELAKLFQRRIPYHLEELKLVDLKTSI